MRLLILGTGGMANSHAKAFGEIEGVEMVGAVDVDPSRARHLPSRTASKTPSPLSMMRLPGENSTRPPT